MQKTFGVPQNRERVFIVSIRKDIDKGTFEFPEPFDNGIRLKDVLEDEVEEKYFLSEKMIKGFIAHNQNHEEKGTGFIWKPRDIDKQATSIRANAAVCPTDNTIKVGEVTQNSQAGQVYSPEGMSPTIVAGTHGYANGNIIEAGNLNNKGWYNSSNIVYSEKGIAPTLTAMQGGNIKPKVMVERMGGIFDKEGEKHQAGSIYNQDGIAPPLDTMQGGYRQPMVNVINATKKGYDTATVGDSINMTYPYSNKKRGRVGHGVAQTLDTGCGQATIVETNKIMVAGNCFPSNHEAGRIVSENGISPTIKENHGTITSVIKNSYPEYRIRKLTPRECWRLMGFGDDDFDKAKATGNSDTQLYKQAGNSIVVNVLEEIFKKLLKEA